MPDPAVTPHGPGGDLAPLLFTVTQAMAATTLRRRRLVKLTTIGAIPSIKIGRSRRYCPRELAAWVSQGCPTDPGAAARVREGMSP